MENKNGEALLHSDATPKTNNFGDKITEKSADMQVSPAFDMLMESVENPTDPSPVTSGMLSVIPLNDMMDEVSKLDPPNPLIKGLWNEYELAVLFGISNCGKSILVLCSIRSCGMYRRSSERVVGCGGDKAVVSFIKLPRRQ